MEIGAKFYPKPEIIIPQCKIPRIPDNSSKV